MTLRHELIRDADRLSGLRDEWDALWRRCPNAHPFQSPAWLVPWWRAFGPGELATIAVWDDDRLAGIAPFYIEDGALGRRLLPIGISLSDYHDVLLEHPDFAAILHEIGTAAARETSWREWDLPELAADAHARKLLTVEGAEREDSPCSMCPVLKLPANKADLEHAIPSKKRRKLAMAGHRARRRGTVEIVRGNAETAPALLEALFDLHTARWVGRQEPGVLGDARVRSFHRDALPALQAAGLLRLYGLRIAGHITATYYGFSHQDRAYGYLSGFDPEFAFESPGQLLLAAVMADAVAEGAREFHFLRGQEAYKYEWGAVDRANLRRTFRR